MDNQIQEYRAALAATSMPFVMPRRFVSAESWTQATTQEGTRYLGLFREHEPDLPAIMTHQRILILGEPGAGKSTSGRAAIQHTLNNGEATEVPVLASLKSYTGNLRSLLIQNTPAPILDAPGITRTYILGGIDEVPATHREALRRELNGLLLTETTAKLVLTSRQAFYAQHSESFPAGLTVYHLLDFDDNDIRACATHQKVNADAFLEAVREIDCEVEIRNPFVLNVMLERYDKLGSLSPLGETEIAETIDFVGGWPNLLSEKEPERWLDGCKQAFIIMDGDRGRELTKRNRPLTHQSKNLQRRFANYPLKLLVLERYGIENYFPRHAYERVLQTDLSKRFPLPHAESISFCPKNLNTQVAEHLALADVVDTDLGAIIRDVKQAAEESREY